MMSTVAEIESAIEKLSPQERRQLCERLLAREIGLKPILERLRSLAGRAKDLPSDLAINHDFYLHGTAWETANGLNPRIPPTPNSPSYDVGYLLATRPALPPAAAAP